MAPTSPVTGTIPASQLREELTECYERCSENLPKTSIRLLRGNHARKLQEAHARSFVLVEKASTTEGLARLVWEAKVAHWQACWPVQHYWAQVLMQVHKHTNSGNALIST